MSSSKTSVILVRFQSHLKFLDKFSKNTQVKFHEILQREPSCSMWTDKWTGGGQTDIKKRILAFRNFANALKKTKL
jgi:hypothetical protein